MTGSDSAKLRSTTARYREHNDKAETPQVTAVRLAAESQRERKLRLASARKSLPGMQISPEMRRILGIVLDELESK
jgi:hypothetical protein